MDYADAWVPPVSPLFRSGAARRALDDLLTARLDEALLRISTGSVVPDFDLARFRQDLGSFNFCAPRPLDGLLDWVILQLEHGVVHMTHPRYFGLFNPAPSFAAECAERIVAAFNPQLASSATSPAAVEIEAHVIGAVARRAGLPSATAGHFTSGGSEANGTALTCALTHADPAFATHGARAFAGAPTVYVSEDAHLAWYKILHQSGLGRSALRLVGTDEAGRMDVEALARAVDADMARGCVPVMIAATAGTTGAGAVDPLRACASVARRVGAWFHVDAAWGGALIACGTHEAASSGPLDGIESADSVTIDAHKWFATTMACGMFLTTHANILSRAFHVAPAAASFMPSNLRDVDPYVTTAQWSRRFLGLRLFLSLASVGWEGHARHVEHAVALTASLRERLAAQGWRPANDSPLAILCLDAPPGFPAPRTIAASVLASGLAWVTTTRLRGRDVIRICVTNGQTTAEDIRILADALQAIGHVREPSNCTLS